MRILLTTIIILNISQPLLGCATPVFRYALEKWAPDTYIIEVSYSTPMSDTVRESVNLLSRYVIEEGEDVNGARANIKMLLRQDSSLKAGQSVAKLYPSGTYGRVEPVLESALSKEMIENMVKSPIRHELVSRLIKGDSAVWLLIESGDPQRDECAYDVLVKELKHQEKTLVLPAVELAENNPFSTEDELQEIPDIDIRFSIIRIAADNARESFLIEQLLGANTELARRNEPVAIPVIGRGRGLLPLVGKGINPSNIARSCEFLAGACSCEVKDQNPGKDLLLLADWSVVSIPDDMPLIGITDYIHEDNVDNPFSKAVKESRLCEKTVDTVEENEPGSVSNTSFSMINNIIIVMLGVGALGFVAVSFNLVKRGRQ
jgi:hypothetical protein